MKKNKLILKEYDDEFKKDDDETGVKPLDVDCDFSW